MPPSSLKIGCTTIFFCNLHRPELGCCYLCQLPKYAMKFLQHAEAVGVWYLTGVRDKVDKIGQLHLKTTYFSETIVTHFNFVHMENKTCLPRGVHTYGREGGYFYSRRRDRQR